MLFPEDDAPHLKNWIVKRLENTSDADADVLADYVLALLRHDGDVKDVRKLCEDEIPDFLKEDSSVFVNDVFNALAYRSYVPGAPPPPSKHAPPPAPAAARPPPTMYDDAAPMTSAPTYQPPLRNTRKRGYNDWDDPDAQSGRDGGSGGRALKQPRRGGMGGRGHRSDGNSSYPVLPPAVPPYPPQAGQLPPVGLPGPSTVGYFDPTGAMGALFGMSFAAGHPMPELLSHDRSHLPLKKRKKCRDWEKKGYCQRGSNCMFAHSNDPIYPPFPGPPFEAMQQAPQRPAAEEYDPTNALVLDMFTGSSPVPKQHPGPNLRQPPKTRGGKHQNRQRRKERAPFSADGPVHDKTRSTIVVENIPEENFGEEQVKDFFAQFGTILEVSMQPYKRLAIVKFETWDSANAAYQSPKVIFDNRFVKVFWYREDKSTSPLSVPLADGTPGVMRTHSTNGHDGGSQADIDLEEFARQQEEKQKAYEEKTKRREELERQQEELEKRQQELIAKQLEEKAKLDAKLAARNGAKSGDGDGESSPSKPMTQTEALRAQLAALEEEARQMGLDPDAMAESPTSPWPSRGGPYGYGRGRGGWRGFSPYTPRGAYRGSYRGRANVHAAYAAYSLDNRPKKVVLTGVDFTASDKDETLRQYLFGIGEFTDIQTTPAATEITFKDRKTAEKFYNSVLLSGKEIPGLDGHLVELAWAGSPSASASAATTPGGGVSTPTAASKSLVATTTAAAAAAAASGGANHTSHTDANAATATAAAAAAAVKHERAATTRGEDMDTEEAGDDGDGAASSSGDKDVHILLDRPPQDLDYEVADENQWGY